MRHPRRTTLATTLAGALLPSGGLSGCAGLPLGGGFACTAIGNAEGVDVERVEPIRDGWFPATCG